MNTHRTVAWLAIVMMITPFLAIPEWLLQIVLTVLGLMVIGTVWLNRPSKPSPKDRPSSSGNSNNKPSTNNPDTGRSGAKDNKDPQQPLDIEDPDADTMVAADRWRRRASRDIS